jgi:hypothetical protein
MQPLTLHLDDNTLALMAQSASAVGQSKSQWVAEAIRHHAAEKWPADCLSLAGRFPDFPLLECAPTTRDIAILGPA